MESEFVTGFKARSNMKRTWLAKLTDKLVEFAGRPVFIILNLVFVLGWIFTHVSWFGVVGRVDPFALLGMVISVEAIVLSLLVLFTQRRQMLVNDVREEVSLKLALRAQQQNSKVLKMLKNIETKLGVAGEDDEKYEKLSSGVDVGQVLEETEKEIEDSEEGDTVAEGSK